jgi:putative ABC transport system substrate-binding protein
MDRRRFLLTSLAGAVTVPLTAGAEQARKLPRIGLLDARQPTSPDPILEGFREGLREAGYTEGQNILVEPRWARAAKQATRTIPIVMLGGDPVADGLISSLCAARGQCHWSSRVLLGARGKAAGAA